MFCVFRFVRIILYLVTLMQFFLIVALWVSISLVTVSV